MSVAEVLPYLRGVKKVGAGWKSQCPAHEDKNPSLSVSATADGKVLFNCFAGCNYKEIMSSLPSIAIQSQSFVPQTGSKVQTEKTSQKWDVRRRHVYRDKFFEPKY